jgi:hypothetical protein
MNDREAFEAWEQSEGLPIDRFPENDRFAWPDPGRYKHRMVDAHWSAWQVAIKQEREACAMVCDDRAKDYWGFTEEEFAFEAAAAAIRSRTANQKEST